VNPDPYLSESATLELYTRIWTVWTPFPPPLPLPRLVRKPLGVCSIEGKEKEKDLKGYRYLQEVLQFCDFFSAIMSFWVTIISMAKLPDKLVNFLHMLGKASSLIFTLNGWEKFHPGFFEPPIGEKMIRKNNANLIYE
jgi:hypothetical protein